MDDPAPAFTPEHRLKLVDLIARGSIGWHPKAHDGEPDAARAALAEIDQLRAERAELIEACKLAYRDVVSESMMDTLRAIILKAGPDGFPPGVCRCCGVDEGELVARCARLAVNPPWGWADETRTLCEGCLDSPED